MKKLIFIGVLINGLVSAWAQTTNVASQKDLFVWVDNNTNYLATELAYDIAITATNVVSLPDTETIPSVVANVRQGPRTNTSVQVKNLVPNSSSGPYAVWVRVVDPTQLAYPPYCYSTWTNLTFQYVKKPSGSGKPTIVTQ